MEIKGKLIEIFETVQVTDSFTKREFILEVTENPKYPELIKFELIQDKCSLIDLHRVGEELTVSFSLKGRRWVNPESQEVKYFGANQAWKLSGGVIVQQKAPQGETEPPIDDLPF